jgi:hypothetical protein
MSEMTKLLEQAVEQARKLPEDEQDAVADALFSCMASAKSRKQLSPEQVEEVKRIRADLQSASRGWRAMRRWRPSGSRSRPTDAGRGRGAGGE